MGKKDSVWASVDASTRTSAGAGAWDGCACENDVSSDTPFQGKNRGPPLHFLWARGQKKVGESFEFFLKSRRFECLPIVAIGLRKNQFYFPQKKILSFPSPSNIVRDAKRSSREQLTMLW